MFSSVRNIGQKLRETKRPKTNYLKIKEYAHLRPLLKTIDLILMKTPDFLFLQSLVYFKKLSSVKIYL